MVSRLSEFKVTLYKDRTLTIYYKKGFKTWDNSKAVLYEMIRMRHTEIEIRRLLYEVSVYHDGLKNEKKLKSKLPPPESAWVIFTMSKLSEKVNAIFKKGTYERTITVKDITEEEEFQLKLAGFIDETI